MFTQIITPRKKRLEIELPEEYFGHRLSITVEQIDSPDTPYSWARALKFWQRNRVDLSGFKFDRESANDR